jgi:hypothetical protein
VAKSWELLTKQLAHRAVAATPLTPTRAVSSFLPTDARLAYASDDSQGLQVRVAPYPGPGQHTQVSTDGGYNPQGGELFYRNGNRTMGVKVTMGTNFSADRPPMLYQGPEAVVTPDG